MAREGCELSTVGRLVEREHDELKARIIPVRIQQRAQVARELCRYWNVAATIRSKTLIHDLVVIAQCTGVQLHHQPIVHRQSRHLHKKMRLEERFVFLRRRTPKRFIEYSVRIGIIEPLGARRDDAVVRCGRSHRLELLASTGDSAHQLAATIDRASCDSRKCFELSQPSRRSDPEQRVGSKRWNHATSELRRAPPQRPMMLESVARPVSRRQYLDL